MQDDNLLYRNKHLNNRDIGLPAINERIEKMNKKFERFTGKRNSSQGSHDSGRKNKRSPIRSNVNLTLGK
jgi:hypothetical protein